MIEKDFWHGKRVLLTGHTGFKGSWLSIWLHCLGAVVSGYALKPPTEPSLFNICRIADLVDSREGDVRDLDNVCCVMQSVQPDIVIHMAAQPLVRVSYQSPVETYQTNVMGTVHVLEAVRRTPSVRAVINVTTDKCYENKEWFWGYRENESMGGYDPYSNSKACSELVTAAFRSSFFNPADYDKHGVAIATARAGNVIGGGDWAEDRLIPDFLRAMNSGEKIRIRNPKAVRPWQHVLEPLCGYLMLAQRLCEEGATFAEGWNFGPDDNDAQPVEWIVQELCRLWGKNAGHELDDDVHPHEAGYLKLDCSKAKMRLDWKPRWCLQEALFRIVAWNKAYCDQQDMQVMCLQQIADYTKARGC